ncbi:MAG TPA: hypothetical protein VJ783_25425 [Pirellulales bacterium]|nr:hypothetical protein [Pirellulales bacterium]
MLDDRLEIFFGEANNAAARVYARLLDEDLTDNSRLTGRVIGPTCPYSQTLSATIPLRAKSAGVSAGGALLAEAVVPDPCFWTTELPFLYRVELQVRQGDQVLASAQRLLGIRRMGTHRRRLLFEGRGWVARGVDVREVPERPLADWRAADLAMIVEQPDDELCAEASRLGVLLIAELAGEGESLAAELRRLARWPAVAMVVLPAGAGFDWASPRAARNLLVGQRVQGSGFRVQDFKTDVLVCEGETAERIAAMASDASVPVIAWRRAGWHDELADARRECDLLQRDLAELGEFAGFLV